MDHNGPQWTTMDHNGLQWNTMETQWNRLLTCVNHAYVLIYQRSYIKDTQIKSTVNSDRVTTFLREEEQEVFSLVLSIADDIWHFTLSLTKILDKHTAINH